MLDLDFGAEQEMLRESLRGLLADACPLGTVRALEDDPIGFAPELWAQLGKLDVLGLLLPEEFGGSGMSLVEGVVLYEEFGRSLAPTPHFVSAVLGGGVLALAGSEEQRAAFLPGIVSGETILTAGWLEAGGGFGPRGVAMAARPDGSGGFLLSGTKRHVAFAAAASHVVVLARTGEEAEAVDLFLVPTDAPGVSISQRMTIGSDAQYDLTLADVVVGEAARIGGPGSGWATWNTVMHDGIILLAAQAMGGARQALEITVQYAKDRHQFDKPLGAFQALAHYLADAQTTVDGGATLVHEAAWARSVGRSVEKLAPMAKLFACQTYRDVTAMAQQVFGGIGFTLEFDIQLYFRRAKQLQISWWDDRRLEELVAATILDAKDV